jgi:hypothetical protein
MNGKFLGFLFSAALGMLAVNAPLKAQVLSPTSSSNAGSISGSQSSSGSTSSATSQGGSAGALGASSVTFNSGNNSPYTSYNPNDVTIRAAPQVYVPSVIGGNLCSLGASAGASWLGAGFAFGASWESQACENRQRVALLYNMGHKDAAKEVLCDTKEVYDGFKRIGQPCIVRPAWEPAQTAAPSAPRPVQPVAAPAPPPKPAFNAAMYASASECLTAASSAGAPLSDCKGKR